MEDGELRSVRETKRIQMDPDGTLRDLAADCLLNPDATVSMNYWGFMPSIFPVMEAYFTRFLQGEGGKGPKIGVSAAHHGG